MPDELNNEAEYKSLIIDNSTYYTLLTKKFVKRRKWESTDKKKISSFIPGVIKKIYVKEKKSVKEGDKLLSFDAMKMENLIIAPADGKIKKIHVTVGQKFAKGEILIEFV